MTQPMSFLASLNQKLASNLPKFQITGYSFTWSLSETGDIVCTAPSNRVTEPICRQIAKAVEIFIGQVIESRLHSKNYPVLPVMQGEPIPHFSQKLTPRLHNQSALITTLQNTIAQASGIPKEAIKAEGLYNIACDAIDAALQPTTARSGATHRPDGRASFYR